MGIEIKTNTTIADELHQLNVMLFTNITYDAFASAVNKITTKLNPNDAKLLSSQSKALANSRLEYDGIDEWIKRRNIRNTINTIAAKYTHLTRGDLKCSV